MKPVSQAALHRALSFLARLPAGLSRKLDRDGRVRIYGLPGGWQYESRVIVGILRTRRLRSDEVVHHRNEDPTDNRPENLALMTRSAHIALHNRTAPKRAKGARYAGDARTGAAAARTMARRARDTKGRLLPGARDDALDGAA